MTRICAACGKRHGGNFCPKCGAAGPGAKAPAEVRLCGYAGCPEPAIVSLPAFVNGHEQPHNRLNVCREHYEREHTLRARARVAAAGVPAELLTATHNPAQMAARFKALREWLPDHGGQVRAVYGGERALPAREPGQDDEERALPAERT